MELRDEVVQRAIMALLFFPALGLLGRKHPGRFLVGLLSAAICGGVLLHSPHAALILYLFICGLVYSDDWDRGIAIIAGGALGLLLLAIFCAYPVNGIEIFPSIPSEPVVSPAPAMVIKFAYVAAFPPLLLWLWPERTSAEADGLPKMRTREESIAAQCEAIRKCTAEGAEARTAIPAIIQFLNVSQEEEVRHACIVALKRMGEPSEQVLAVLEAVMQDPGSSELKAAAAAALRELTAVCPPGNENE